MANAEEYRPQAPVVESIRVDKVGRGARTVKSLRAVVAVVITVVLLIPVFWMILTTFKSQSDAIAVPPKVFFEPRPLDSFVFLFTDRFLLARGKLNQYPDECRTSWRECLANDCADPKSG
jgi:ABC-type glycerol-3-phosphate transport system permease component